MLVTMFGDVAGMGADLFGSCAESTCAALVIGAVAFATNLEALLFPILISAVGIPVSLVTMFTARVKEEKDVAPALKRLLIVATGLSAAAMYFVSMWSLPESFEINGEVYTKYGRLSLLLNRRSYRIAGRASHRILHLT